MSLHSKSSAVLQYLSRYFLSIDLETKIQTVSEFSESLDVARGTIQNTINYLRESKAIKLSAHGKLGTYLKEKDVSLLISFSNITFIVGAMPLPYSKLYEGLSTGIIQELNGKLNVPVNMSYMRGALKRIELVSNGRYDFAIVSKYAAHEYLHQNPESIKIGIEFGKETFVKEHVLILNDKKKKQIEDGMRVGIDYDSIDQRNLTFEAVKNKRIELVPLTYTQFLNNLFDGNIDAAIWNVDEVNNSHNNFNIVKIPEISELNTTAVMVFSTERTELMKLIQDNLNINKVLKTQTAVISGTLQPEY